MFIGSPDGCISNRELPMLTIDYAEDTDFENRQREHTLRSVATWDHFAEKWKAGAKGGYIISSSS